MIFERCKSRWEKGAVREIIAKHLRGFVPRSRKRSTAATAPSRVAIALNCTDDEGVWFSVMDLRSRVAGKTRANRETSRRLPLHSMVCVPCLAQLRHLLGTSQPPAGSHTVVKFSREGHIVNVYELVDTDEYSAKSIRHCAR